MIPFLKLAKPVKRPASDSKVNYEQKRVRKFQHQWQKDRPWLVYDSENNLMSCAWCKKEGVQSKFTTGSNHFRIDAVKDHEESKWHKHFTSKYSLKTHSESLASKCLLQLKKADYDKMAIKFRTAHAIAKHNKSFLDYTFICQLDKMKGLDVGEQYLNDKSAATMIHHIVAVTRSEVCEKLRHSLFFSLTCDGVTDFTGDELENIYVRICNKGVVEVMYLHIGSPDSTSASDLHLMFQETFQSLEIHDVFKDKLIGFCADGASNMQGCKSGLGALLKETRPHLVVVHCLAHRLELSFKDAIKSCQPSLYTKCMTLLIGLFYLYHKSPTQKKALQRSFASLEMKQVLPTRVGGTRCLPHTYRAITVLIKGYKAIRQQLETSSHNNAKAEGYARLISDGHVIAYILKLKEIITHLMKLSLYLQTQGICLADGFHRLGVTKTLLTHMEPVDVLSVKEVIESESYQGTTLSFQGGKPNARVQNFVTSLKSSLEKRFPSTEIVESTVLASFINWPEKGSENIPEFGNKEVKFLADQFHAYYECSEEDLLQEWALLKAVIYEKYDREIPLLSWKDVMIRFGNHGLENIFKLMDITLCLPPTSVNNECAFSAMKLCKGKRRGRMKATTLNDLLTIQIQSESVKNFDPEQAIKHRMKTPSGQKRRLINNLKKTCSSTQMSTKATSTVTQPLPAENEVDIMEVVEDSVESMTVTTAQANTESDSALNKVNSLTEDVNAEADAEADLEESETESEESDMEMTELEIERELERI